MVTPRFIIISILLVCRFIISLPAQIYLDSTYSVSERVDDLLARMTLDEKMGQMALTEFRYLQDTTDITTYNLGVIFSGGEAGPGENTALEWADMIDRLQRQALATRLKIPLLFGLDAVHGHNHVYGAVIFPHNIGIGCMQDIELAEKSAYITAQEMLATGARWTFAPCIAVPRNERWGRTYEGFGETPELAEKFGSAFIRGFNGYSGDSSIQVLTSAKHFIADGATANGIDRGNALIAEELRTIHLPGYQAALDAGVGSIMAGFHSINGVEMVLSKDLLSDLLRGELGFKGFLVSDWGVIRGLPGSYGTNISNAIQAGIDMDMLPDNYKGYLTALRHEINLGNISLERIDAAVKRILTQKFRLGLFEKPFSDRSQIDQVGSPEHRDVARECVRKSLVLLKKKDGILPLAKENIKILVTGNNADDMAAQCGGWTINWQTVQMSNEPITIGTTILQALKEAAPNADVTYSDKGIVDDDTDVIVAVIGEKPYAENYGDRRDLRLNYEDVDLIRNLKQSGKPVIVVLISGRPMIIDAIMHFCDVFIAAWLPGTEGRGITDILFGDFQPSGKLSHSWPQNMDQIPINVGEDNYNPLYPYGYGLSTVNDSDPGSSPILNSAIVDYGKRKLELTFNKELAPPPSGESSFDVRLNNSIKVHTGKMWLKDQHPNTLVIELYYFVQGTDTVKISYTPGNIMSYDNGVLETFSDFGVWNMVSEIYNIPSIPGRVEAENYVDHSGVHIEVTSDTSGELNVTDISNDDWFDYDVYVDTTGSYDIFYRVAASDTGGKIRLEDDGILLAETNIPKTGSWENWTTTGSTLQLKSGKRHLRLLALTGGFKLNWFELDRVTSLTHQENYVYKFQLAQNYPNPFNPVTKISFMIPQSDKVILEVYNILGQKVETIFQGSLNAGLHEVEFEAKDLTSGIYFYRIQAGYFSAVRKMILLR